MSKVKTWVHALIFEEWSGGKNEVFELRERKPRRELGECGVTKVEERFQEGNSLYCGLPMEVSFDKG